MALSCSRVSASCSVLPTGVKVITAPITVTAQFKEPLLVPGKVTVSFWEAPENKHQSQSLYFQMQQHGGGKAHLVGLISRC